jgi:hypothetical protein
MQYTRIYADSAGESHFEVVEVALTLVNFAPPAPPIYLSPFSPARQFGFLSTPPAWYGDWHPTPHRQFFFSLIGEIELEVSDGEVRRFGPGSVFLLEDTTGKGHRTQALGTQETLFAIVQLPDA